MLYNLYIAPPILFARKVMDLREYKNILTKYELKPLS